MHRHLKIRSTAAALLALAAVPALAGTASAADSGVTADFTGDGKADTAALAGTGDPARQQLVFNVVDGGTSSIVLPADPVAGPQDLRVTDINGDGRAEVLVTFSRGANTDFSTFVELGPDGPRTLTGPDGTRFDVTEGGGIAARLGYECASNAEGGRDLITLGATRIDTGNGGELVYEGQRTRYAVENGALTEVDTYNFAGAGQDDPVLKTDPASCA
ncbi:VCBS repeat-containing protein [Amycolatopsis sp. 195334CR]|uniref:FG-GAP repeat domain-containing protein n=1 Tax=Amycolatopsis sp. 195334CR TaxID=2814588 RepID=UPI001A8C1A51|nr:VCBS repeat-containing protein [Amycolatopsis sp. 195334CR]MBN6033623.1 VCBS repeat-containing protein [Amycolatopsis sp. 195334CR]